MNRTANVIVMTDDLILNKIYMIRGKKVMLDKDLAALYGVEIKQLKRQAKRNSERFPADFMFELNSKELKIGGAKLAPPISVIKWDCVMRPMPLPNKAFPCCQVS